MPLVTIGIPFFNPGRFLIDAIKSICVQTFTDWELILINDGSTDESIDFVKKIKDKRVIFINDNVNLGLPIRLNQIIELARGEYIARMDSDDLSHPRRIEKQLKVLIKNESIDLVASPAIIIDENQEPVGKMGIPNPQKDKALETLKIGPFIHPTIIARKRWFLENNYSIDFPRAEDRELFARTITSLHYFITEEPLYFYYFQRELRKQAWLKGYESERKVILKYGPDLVGRTLTYSLLLRSLAKSMLIEFFSILGKEDSFLSLIRRYSPLALEEVKHYKGIIQIIKNQNIPEVDKI